MKKILFLFLLLTSLTSFAKEVKVIIPFSAGGPTDKVARVLINHLSNDQYKFVPEYKLGAGGAIAANYVASAKTENVLLVTTNGLVSAPILSNSTSYSLDKDFLFINHLGSEPLILVVKEGTKINNFRDFIKASKTEFMPYGSAGIGTSGHIASAIVSQNNTNFIHIPYKGSAGLVIDLINDQLKWLLDSEMNIGSFINDKKVKPIAVYARKRLPSYPNIPTLKELGIDNKNYYRWHILVSNKFIDENILKYVQERLKDNSLKINLSKLGLETDDPNLDNFLVNEYIKTENIIKELKIN